MTSNAGPYDAQGFNSSGLSSYGYDRAGFYPNGWSIYGLSANGTRFDEYGFNQNGFHSETGTRQNQLGQSRYFLVNEALHSGRDEEGFDADGLDRFGFDRNEIHGGTETPYNNAGRDREGVDRDGFNEEGFFQRFWPEECEAAGRETMEHRDTRTRFGPFGFNSHGLNADSEDSTGRYWETY